MISIATPGLASSITGTLLLGVLLVPSGFAIATATNVLGFQQRPRPEQLLWSVSLSAPLAVLISVLGERFGGTYAPLAALLLLAVSGALLAIREFRQSRSAPRGTDRDLRLLGWVIAACVLLEFARTAAVQIGSRLYEGAFSSDWGIRVGLQWAANNTRVPPINPFFTLDGHSSPLRYYYFFYILCAQPARMLHLSPRAVLVAGTIWAMLAFFATCFLLLQHLVLGASARWQDFGEQTQPLHLWPQAVLFVGLSAVMGLDLPVSLFMLSRHVRLWAVTEWWRSERSGTLFSGLEFGPHHFMGIACALLGYLLLVLVPRSRGRVIVHGVLAGLCFAATAGMSTFVMLGMAVAILFLCVDSLFRRTWRITAGTALATVTSLLLDGWFLRQMLTSQGLSRTASSGAGGRFLTISLRNLKTGESMTWGRLLPYFHLQKSPSGLWSRVESLPFMLLLYATELGMFWFVLWYRGSRDARRVSQLSAEERAMWLLLAGVGLPALLLTSSPVQGENDLGRHLGTMVRVVLTLWACPMIATAYRRIRRGPALPVATRRVFAVAALCGVLGFAAQVWDVVVQRFYIPMQDAGLVTARSPFVGGQDISSRYAEFRRGWQAVGHTLPLTAVVQSDPYGEFQNATLLYLNRREAAGDISCLTAFGGDTDACRQVLIVPLLALYGQGVMDPKMHFLERPPDMSPATFVRVCQSLQLSALFANDHEQAWLDPNSWVWHEPVLYAGDHVRVLRCPVQNSLGAASL